MPPPSPPGPPPLPIISPVLSNSSGHQRNLLLQSIRQGTKLKKTVTIDKSAPFITVLQNNALFPGKVAGVSKTFGSDNESSRNVSSNSGMSKQININGKPSGLGNLFAGGIPKLKPVNWTGSTLSSNKESLTFKLSESKNRGPPPQPPLGNQKSIISSSASDSVLTLSYSSSNITSRVTNDCLLLSNKSNTGGYGKPNVAPKPPTAKESLFSQTKFNSKESQTGLSDNLRCSQNILSNCQEKPSPPPKKITLNNRSGVNRAQSMRVPKSPPVAPTASPPFPPFHKQTLVKNKTVLLQSQDDLNGKNFMISKTGTLPHHFQKTVFPPNMPPPPAPNQRIPTRPPISKPPPPPSRPAPPPAPPLPPPPPPPHRTAAAPSLPQTRSISGIGNCPPPPPVRNLSVRNGFFPHQNDIENKFAHLFHKVQEFPCPGAFKNLIKNYNTRASSIAKQPAPPPPPLTSTSMLQLNSKLWVSNTSQC